MPDDENVNDDDDDNEVDNDNNDDDVMVYTFTATTTRSRTSIELLLVAIPCKLLSKAGVCLNPMQYRHIYGYITIFKEVSYLIVCKNNRIQLKLRQKETQLNFVVVSSPG